MASGFDPLPAPIPAEPSGFGLSHLATVPCLERWGGQCVDLGDLALVLTLSGEDSGENLLCGLLSDRAAVLIKSPSPLLSFPRPDELDRRRDPPAIRADGWRMVARRGLTAAGPGARSLRPAPAVFWLRSRAAWRCLAPARRLAAAAATDVATDPQVLSLERQIQFASGPDLVALTGALRELTRAATVRARQRLEPLLRNRRLTSL
jgi:hypothetical protein